MTRRLLLIQSLDDLKDRLARVVVLIPVITFFQRAMELPYETSRDVLFLALGTLLAGSALFLSSRKGEHGTPCYDRLLYAHPYSCSPLRSGLDASSSAPHILDGN